MLKLTFYFNNTNFLFFKIALLIKIFAILKLGALLLGSK
jgi:hypothetical protein